LPICLLCYNEFNSLWLGVAMKEYLLGAALLLIVIGGVYSVIKNNRDLIRNLKQKYGAVPKAVYDRYTMDRISLYWRVKSAENTIPFAVDDTTWNDLDMDKVFMRINNAASSVGEETLYCKLREQEFQGNKLSELEDTMQYFDHNEKERLKVQFYLAKLGKEVSSNLIDFLFNPKDKKLKNPLLFPFLMSAAVVALISILFFPVQGLVGSSLILMLNIFVYYKTKATLQANFLSVHYFSALLLCAKKISNLKISKLASYADKIKILYGPMKKISRLSGMIISKPSSELEFVFEYLKMFFLIDFVFYNFMLSAIQKHQQECIEIYETIGFLDMAISIASYRRSVEYYVLPEFIASKEMDLQKLVHPLLAHAVSNSVVIKRSLLITGSNASGKSTFVKAAAINMILAQTIHTCLAERFMFMPSFVVTSMAVKDDVEAGESYYIAEIKSLKRIMDLLNEQIRCIAFVDEILKGTNTIERIAASASILDFLKDENCVAIVATHDIELTDITNAYFDNFHFRETINDEGIVFDYTIYPGKATTKNAIKLLSFTGYDKQITDKAEEIARDFEINRIWKAL